MRPKRRVSMDSDIEEIPLNNFISDGPPSHKKSAFEKLRRYSIQTCEFCEAKCENRIDMLIHNSTHIIIPLLKETPCRCYKCGFFCISEEHLINHLSVKHNILMKKKTKKKIVPHLMTEEEFETEEHYTDDETLDDLVKKEQIGSDSALLQGFFLNCKVDIEKFDTPWLDTSNKVNRDQEGTDVCSKYTSLNGLNSFTEDIIKVEPSSTKKIKNDNAELNTEVEKECNGDTKHGFLQSVHYDELMKPGIYQCKHCFKRFPTRYDAIVHETVHVDLSWALRKRPGRPPKCLQLHQKQLYTPTKHECRTCRRCYSSSAYLMKHMKICMRQKARKTSKKSVKVCERCISLKLKGDYTVMGTSCDLRKFCWYCKDEFEKLFIVQLARKPHTDKPQSLADRIKFEDSESKTECNNSELKSIKLKGRLKSDRNSKPPKTNNERLKLIRNRFKLINKSLVYVPKFAKDGVRKDTMIC